MNRAAERQVKTGNALRVQNRRLVPGDRAARAALARALDDAIADEAEMPDSGFTLALPEGEKAGLVATILPLNRGERRNLGGAATAAIFVQDPVVVPPFPGEAFASCACCSPWPQVLASRKRPATRRPRHTYSMSTARPAPRSRPNSCTCS
jgi:hypothetical protein